MPEQMTIDEVNRYIHEKIMGKCVHDRKYLGHVKYGTDEPATPYDLQSHGKYACTKCPDVSFNGGKDSGRCPDYCSADSPHRFLTEPWRLTTMFVGWEDLEEALASELEKELIQPYAGELSKFNFACASPEQKSRAIVNAHKSMRNTLDCDVMRNK